MMETTITPALQTKDSVLVQTSFAKLETAAEPLTDLFFARLFQMEPAFRDLFPNDLRPVKRALMAALARLVREADSSDEWHPEIEQLGRRHLGYGVEAKHYHIFGQAFFWTMEKGLGEDCTLETLQAWQHWYTQLVSIMQPAQADFVRTENARRARAKQVNPYLDKEQKK